MDDKLARCSQCNKEIIKDKSYSIFKIVVITKEKEYDIGISRMLHDLSEYAMGKWYHLSSSEIILLRPDIVSEFLKEAYKDEGVLEWRLEGFYICDECFEIYKELIPLI